MALTTLNVQDASFKLNGTPFTGLVGFTPPSVAKQLRLITTIADKYPVYESSKYDTDSDFVVDCIYNTGSAEQEALIAHVKGALTAGTAVSSSQFQMLFGSATISGSCLPMGYTFGKIEAKPDAVAIQFNFKKVQIGA